MSLAVFRKALDDLPDPVTCEGTYALTERLAIALPDGDVAAVDDATFVDWLVEHSEPAPFGQGGETKLDPQVRHALRLRARGGATVHGFEPDAVLDEIAAVLSPHEHLVAKLTDVVTYPLGGHFARHKDTPYDAALVATLVVGLPIEHGNGALVVGDVHAHWGTPTPGELPWIALYSDADHEIDEVTWGTRVTLVYELSRSGRPRADAAYAARVAGLAGVARSLELPVNNPLMIACTRLVATADATQPQPIAVLRGADRAIAEALVAAGFAVAVRACIAAASDEDDGRPSFENYDPIGRLARPVPPDVIAGIDGEAVTFSDSASSDEDGEYPATNLGPYLVDHIYASDWVISQRAALTQLGYELFDAEGYFGNQGHLKYIYMLAALEVTKPRAHIA